MNFSPKEIRKELVKTGQYFFCFWYGEAMKYRAYNIWRDIKYLEGKGYTPKQVTYILNIAQVMGNAKDWLYRAEDMYKEYNEEWDTRIQLAEFGEIKGYHCFRPNPNNEKQKTWFKNHSRVDEFLECIARGYVDGSFGIASQDKSLGYLCTFPMFNLAYPKHFKTEREALKFDRGYGFDSSTGVEKLPLNWRYIYSK